MAAGLAVRLDGDPIRMRIVNVLVRGVRIDAGDHVHTKFAASGYHFAEGVAVAEIFAAVMQRDFGRIKSHAAAGAQARGIGMDSLEIVQPETLCSGLGRLPRTPIAPIAWAGRTNSRS